MIRAIVADDHHLVRQGIRALLEKAGDIRVIGEAADGREAVELVERLAPDVLVLDISMPGLDGIQAIKRIRTLGRATRVVILSMYSDATLVRQALQSGANGYLLKGSLTEELLLAVRAANKGEVFLSPGISGSIVDELLAVRAGGPGSGSSDLLSAREAEVLQLISEGNTSTEIAESLKISVKTVEKHRAALMSKLGVHGVAGLIRVAIKKGLIFLDK
ncbi:MAG: response regulator transcription factor [candidate division NC10 bacterium]|nr:response regulator transcription factor [candidate division NC10 bacterium]